MGFFLSVLSSQEKKKNSLVIAFAANPAWAPVTRLIFYIYATKGNNTKKSWTAAWFVWVFQHNNSPSLVGVHLLHFWGALFLHHLPSCCHGKGRMTAPVSALPSSRLSGNSPPCKAGSSVLPGKERWAERWDICETRCLGKNRKWDQLRAEVRPFFCPCVNAYLAFWGQEPPAGP